MKKLLLTAVGVGVFASMALAHGMNQGSSNQMMNQKEQVQRNHMDNSQMGNHGNQGNHMNNSGNHMNDSQMGNHGNQRNHMNNSGNHMNDSQMMNHGN